MFLEKLEDLAYFNRIMRDTPELEPYFAELAVWCWIYQREKYLEVVKEYEEQLQNGTIEKVNSALEKMEIEKHKVECINLFGQQNGTLIAQGNVKINMTIDMCRYAWGNPLWSNKTTTEYRTVEDWYYGLGYSLHFENGLLKRIEE